MVNSLHVHAKQPVPGILGKLGHESEVHDSGVAHQHIHVPDLPERRFHLLPAGHIAADGGGAGFFRHRPGGGVVGEVKKENRQPWAANRSTAAAPMPREPPVITTVSIKESFLKKTGCKQPVQRFKSLTEFAARGGK